MTIWKDYRYKNPEPFSEKLSDDYAAIKMASFEIKSAMFKAFFEIHKIELAKRREIVMQNISNFCFLVEQYSAKSAYEIRPLLEEFRHFAGYFLDFENGFKAVCKYLECLRVCLP